jgi:hypothetical protein
MRIAYWQSADHYKTKRQTDLQIITKLRVRQIKTKGQADLQNITKLRVRQICRSLQN